MSVEGAMKWLVCVAEGDREGLTINEHTAKMAVDIRWEIERLRSEALDARKAFACAYLAKETDNERLRAINAELLAALEILAGNDLNETNCASVEVAAKRVRNIARAAMRLLTELNELFPEEGP